MSVPRQGERRRGVVIVHSLDDGTIDHRDSRRLAKALGGPPGVKLLELVDAGEDGGCGWGGVGVEGLRRGSWCVFVCMC
jgi:hypothetical protein